MTGRKLRNIFVAKYLPLLKRMEGLKVEEKYEENRIGDDYTAKTYNFEIYLPNFPLIYTVIFKDNVWDDGTVKSWVYMTIFNWWEVPQEMGSEDWRKFYGRFNILIARILSEMVAHHFPDARSYKERIILPNGTVILFKFTLSKLHIIYQSDNDLIGDNLTDVPIDLPKEGDIIQALVKALSFFLL
jgi:hypothetical protein